MSIPHSKIWNQAVFQKSQTIVISFKLLISFLLIIVFFVQTKAQNQKISVEHLGIEQGMSSQEVGSVLRDSKGFLWFTTIKGLERYDGYSFTTFQYKKNPKSIGEFMGGTIAEDKLGNIWTVSVNGGLEKFDPVLQTFKNYIPDRSKAQNDLANTIYSVLTDRNDILWVGTGFGLYRFNKEDETFTAFRYNENDPFSLGHNSVDGIYEDKSGTIWIATGGGLDRLDRGTYKFYHYWHYPKNPWGDPKTKKYWLHQIIEDGDSVLWIASDGGLLKFDKRSEKCILFHRDKSTRVGFNKSIIISLCEDDHGRIWLGTDNGIDIFNKNSCTFVNLESWKSVLENLNRETILDITIDKSGLLWIVTDLHGVYKVNFPDPSFNNYVYEIGDGDKFSLDRVLQFWEEKNGNIWVSTNKGYCLMDIKSGRLLKKYVLQNIADVYKVKSDLWAFPNRRGLYKLDLKHNSWECYIDSTAMDYAYIIDGICIGKENIWIGNRNNELLSLNLKSKEIKPITKIRGIIYTIYEDSYGLVWFGGFSTGLFCYNPETDSVTEYSSDPNDSTTIIDGSFSSYLEDKKGNLWFGCNTGIVKFNRVKNNFTRFYGNSDFMKEFVSEIIEDDNGNLWISTKKGITKFNPETGHFKYYYSSKYFPEITFYRLVGFKAGNGELYFGGRNGFTRFHPDSLNDNAIVPPIAITAFKKFDKYYPFGKEIKLDYDDNYLTFEFAALSYVHSEENQYAYMMEGIDKDWVYCGTRRFATYPNLNPGEYIFKVKGSDCNRVWNEAGTSIEVIILPPWWKTWWAYIIYILVIISVFMIFTRFYLNRQRLRQKLILESEHAGKLEEIAKMKSDFFANISHEFRTPLTLILGPAEKIERNESLNPSKDAGIIRRNSKRLLQLVNQLLDLSRLDSGKLKLEASPGNIVSFVKGIALSFESLSESRDIMISIHSEKEFIEVYFDREKMIKALSNLLSNAFKFTPDREKVIVNISTTPNGSVIISIRNTGIAIPQSEFPKLFDRFYQVDSTHTKEYKGTGIGLALVKELIELHHGSISVDSRDVGQDKLNPVWTEFTISLPLGRDHLGEDEIISAGKIVSTEDDFAYETDFPDPYINPVSEPEKDGNKRTILVVEDNYDMREYIKESLSDTYLIEEAINGEQGVRIAEKSIPDLIISDLMMPKMDGTELAGILKNDERTSHIPIIILTAKSGQENKIEGLQTGADEYLTKPFDLRELRVRVENLICIRKKLQEKFSGGDFLLMPAGKKLQSLDEKFLARVLEVIERHLSEEDFSIEECSNEVGMSRSHLHKKLKALVGKSPSQYVRSVRLHHAKRMIEEQRGNISEAAYSVGFSTPAYFSKCFKDEFGYPPRNILS